MLFSLPASMLPFPLEDVLENGIEDGGFHAETYSLHAILSPERYLDFGRSQSLSPQLFSAKLVQGEVSVPSLSPSFSPRSEETFIKTKQQTQETNSLGMELFGFFSLP